MVFAVFVWNIRTSGHHKRGSNVHHIYRKAASFGTNTSRNQIQDRSKTSTFTYVMFPSSFCALAPLPRLFHIPTKRFAHTGTNSANKEVSSSTSATSAMLTMTGEECYKRSIEFFEKHKEYQQRLEEDNANEQYEAMMKMSIRSNNPTSPAKETKNYNRVRNQQANIAVVQTIAKQTREKRSKRQGDTSNQYGELNEEKSIEAGDEKDFEKRALEYMQFAAFVHGHPKALVRLGNEALDLAKREEASPDEGEKLSSLQNPDIFIPPSMDPAIDIHHILQNNNSLVDVAKIFYQEAIDRGNNKAAVYNLAHLLWTESEFDVEGNRKKMESIQLFRRGAMELNDIDASYFLGVQYITLFGTIPDDGIVEKDIPHAPIVLDVMAQNNLPSATELRRVGYEMIQKASVESHGGASYYLSLLHRNGDIGLGIQPSIPKFQHYLDLACEGSALDSDALYLRAHCIYHNEDGYGRSSKASISSGSHYLKDALRDFMKAGQAGNPNGYISAGAMLHNGHGKIIERDQRKAFELYQEAAEMGSKDGWRNVVACYALGQGVPQCEQTAKYITKTMLSDDDDK